MDFQSRNFRFLHCVYVQLTCQKKITVFSVYEKPCKRDKMTSNSVLVCVDDIKDTSNTTHKHFHTLSYATIVLASAIKKWDQVDVLFLSLIFVPVSLTSSDSKTWQIILYCFLASGAPGVVSMQSCEAERGMRLRAIKTTMFPMSAMYEIVRRALSIIVSCRNNNSQNDRVTSVSDIHNTYFLVIIIQLFFPPPGLHNASIMSTTHGMTVRTEICLLQPQMIYCFLQCRILLAPI